MLNRYASSDTIESYNTSHVPQNHTANFLAYTLASSGLDIQGFGIWKFSCKQVEKPKKTRLCPTDMSRGAIHNSPQNDQCHISSATATEPGELVCHRFLLGSPPPERPPGADQGWPWK